MPAEPLIVIGGGEGAAEPARRLLKALPADLSASVLLSLVPSGESKTDLMLSLRGQAVLPVRTATERQRIERGCVLMAPAGSALVIRADGRLGLAGLTEMASGPVDALFTSAAKAYGNRVIGVVLSGAGHDGTAGLRAIAASNGVSIVQSPSDSAHAGMPVSALLGDEPDHSALVQQIGPLLVRLTRAMAAPS